MPKVKKAKEIVANNTYTITGKNGTGKTRFASTFGDKVLLIDFNDGGAVSIQKEDVLVYSCETILDIIKLKNAILKGDLVNYLELPWEPEVIIFDTWTQYVEMYKSYYKSQGKHMEFSQWQDVTQVCKLTVEYLKKQKQYTVIHICQETFEIIEDKQRETKFIKYDTKLTPALKEILISGVDNVWRTWQDENNEYLVQIGGTFNTPVKSRTRKNNIKAFVKPNFIDIKKELC